MPNLIDLDEAEVLDMTVEEVRKFIGVIDAGDPDNDFTDLVSELDRGQGGVKSGDHDQWYIFIRISP